jgi:hypothetical protein
MFAESVCFKIDPRGHVILGLRYVSLEGMPLRYLQLCPSFTGSVRKRSRTTLPLPEPVQHGLTE